MVIQHGHADALAIQVAMSLTDLLMTRFSGIFRALVVKGKITNSNLPACHWDRVTHICVGKLVIIVSDNGLSPVRRQAIIWTNAGILSNLSKILIEIHAFSFKKMQLKYRLENGGHFVSAAVCYGLVTYIRLWTGSSLVQIIAYRLFGVNPLPEPMQTYHQFHTMV